MTLINKFNICTSSDEFHALLHELADRLIKNDPSLMNENDELCKRLCNVDLSRYFKDKTVNIKNSDDVKYHLRINRANYYFYNNHSDEFKADHFAMLVDLLSVIIDSPDFRAKLLSYDLETIELARKKLIGAQNIDPHNTIIWISLMILSKYYPINAECSFTLEKIPSHFRVFSSSGHQFNTDLLFTFHDDRVRKGKDTLDHKFLINVISNKAFCTLDAAYLFMSNLRSHNIEVKIPDIYNMKFINSYRAFEHFSNRSVLKPMHFWRMAALSPITVTSLLYLMKKHDVFSYQLSTGEKFYSNDFLSFMNVQIMLGTSIEAFSNDLERQMNLMRSQSAGSSSRMTAQYNLINSQPIPTCIRNPNSLENRWEPQYDPGDGVLRRCVQYIIKNSRCVEYLEIFQKDNQGFALFVVAGQNQGPSTAALKTAERNSRLNIELANAGVTPGSPRVKQWPANSHLSLWDSIYELQSDAEHVQSALEKVVQMIKKLEGENVFGDLENEILNRIPSVVQGLRSLQRVNP